MPLTSVIIRICFETASSLPLLNLTPTTTMTHTCSSNSTRYILIGAGPRVSTSLKNMDERSDVRGKRKLRSRGAIASGPHLPSIYRHIERGITAQTEFGNREPLSHKRRGRWRDQNLCGRYGFTTRGHVRIIPCSGCGRAGRIQQPFSFLLLVLVPPACMHRTTRRVLRVNMRLTSRVTFPRRSTSRSQLEPFATPRYHSKERKRERLSHGKPAIAALYFPQCSLII